MQKFTQHVSDVQFHTHTVTQTDPVNHYQNENVIVIVMLIIKFQSDFHFESYFCF